MPALQAASAKELRKAGLAQAEVRALRGALARFADAEGRSDKTGAAYGSTV